MFRLATLCTSLLLGCAIAMPALAQYGGTRAISDIDPKTFEIDEKRYLGEKLIVGTELIDENGQEFKLSDLLGKPLILVLSYYQCDGSCSVINENLHELLDGVDGQKMGEDFNVLTISFDTHDNLQTLGAFKTHMKRSEEIGPGWTFATFKDPTKIDAFTKDIGYKYFWSPRDRTFFHPGVFLFVTPEGRLARVLQALSSGPDDIELAVLEARQGNFKPSEVVQFAVSLCYSYNYAEGRYTYNIPLIVGAGSLTIGIVAFTVSVLVFRRRKMREVV